MAYDNQKFFYENLVEQATLTASSENAQYPLSNILDDRRTKVFRSTSNDTNVVFDFGTARPVDMIMLVDSGLRGFGFLTATLEFNNSDLWTTPAYSIALTIDSTYGFAFAEMASTQSFRYARLVLTNTAGYCELSNLFLGQALDIGDMAFSYPIRFAQENNASITKNRFGQRFIDEVNSYKTLSGQLQTLNKSEVEALFEMAEYVSITRPIWVYFPEALSNVSENNNRLSGYYYLKADPDLSLVAGNFWNTALTLEEGT
jgi:hypothetical protein